MLSLHAVFSELLSLGRRCLRVPREPVRLVVVLTGHAAREPVVMHPRVFDHEVLLVMLMVNLLFTLQVLGLRKCAITKFRG